MVHCRTAGYCASGVREYFRINGLDYSGFLFNGIDSKELLEACNNDQMAIRVVEIANEQQQEGHSRLQV